MIKNVFIGPKVEEASQEDIDQLKATLGVREDQEISKVYRASGYIYDAQRLEPYLVIVLPVIVCGFLLIFDCFYLTISRDLRECVGFINLAVIKTQLRKSEFVILRSIGMTRKQMTKMLIAEGLCDTAILILSVATIGNVLVYGIDTFFLTVINFR